MKQAQECTFSDEDDEEDYHKGLTSTTDDANKDNMVLWGKAYKNNHVIGKTRWKDKHGGSQQPKKIKKTHLSQQEKLLLINEFTSSMFNSFLDGKDEFNYRYGITDCLYFRLSIAKCLIHT